MADLPTLNAKSPRSTGLPYTFKATRFSSHAAIGSAIQERAKRVQDEPYTVLDIGCAYGFVRPYLPARRFYLIGAELDKEATEKARAPHDEVYLADMSAAQRLPLPCPVHTIVFGETLEHVTDPLMARQSVHRSHSPAQCCASLCAV